MDSFTPYPELNTVLRDLLCGVQTCLGERFVGLYCYGSLASGDFDPARSDIDFVVLTDADLPEALVADLKALHTRLWARGGKWAAKLEGSYVPRAVLRRHDPSSGDYPTVNEGQFFLSSLGTDWIIQRYILRGQGIVVYGPPPHTLIDPVLPDDLRGAVRGFLDEWWRPMLAEPSRLASREYQAYAVLTMCRALYTLKTGEIGSKPVSARWAESVLGPVWTGLIEQALAWPDDPQPDRFGETLEFIRLTIKIKLC